MVVHHIITLFLLFLSYTSNFVRVGSLVLLTHDVADGILELAKLCKYAKRDRLCDVVFGVFTVVWVATRQVGKGTIVQSEEGWLFLENRSALGQTCERRYLVAAMVAVQYNVLVLCCAVLYCILSSSKRRKIFFIF